MDIIKFAASIFTVFVASYFGSILALKKHKKEKIWEAKHKTYSDILNAISSIHSWAEEHYASTVPFLPSSSKEKLEQLNKEYENSRHELWKFVRISELIITKQSINILNELLTDIEKERFRFIEEYTDGGPHDEEYRTHLGVILDIVNKYLPKLITSSKEDLK